MALGPGKRLAAALGGSLALIAVGAGATIAWEHKAPWGLEAKRAALEARIQDPVTGYVARLKQAEDAATGWESAYRACEDTRQKEAGDAADAVSRASEIREASNGAAFNQGYAAGRAVGLKRCGGNIAPEENPSPGPGPVAGDGGLSNGTDLSTLFGAGAYVPGRSSPAQP